MSFFHSSSSSSSSSPTVLLCFFSAFNQCKLSLSSFIYPVCIKKRKTKLGFASGFLRVSCSYISMCLRWIATLLHFPAFSQQPNGILTLMILGFSFLWIFYNLQAYIVYMGERPHDEPDLIKETHHEILTNLLGRFHLPTVCLSIYLLVYIP